MPQTVSDTSLSSGIVSNGGTDLFQYPDAPAPSILGLQATWTQPLPPGTSTTTGLLVPDQNFAQRLANFPSGIYDLSPSSVLTHFLQAILGDTGAGQVRKRQMLARLQSAITSTHFYDLDSFYGALFGCQRGPSGTLPGNPSTGLPVSPYTELASPDAWDEIQAIDAQFRERVIALARAIALGGTVPGLRALAEAVSGVPCQVYEIWRLLDAAEGPLGQQPVTWAHLEAQYPTWNSFPSGATWASLEGVVSYSGMGIGAANEIVIQPRKHYASDVTSRAQQSADLFGILSVTEVLKPACALVTVDVNGTEVVSPVPLTGAWADSQYWEIAHLISPSPADPAYQAATAAYQGSSSPDSGPIAQPVPPLSRGRGGQYSHAADVTTVSAQAVIPGGPLRDYRPGPGKTTSGTVTDSRNWETTVFPGGPVDYLPSSAVITPQRAASARAASAVALKSAPYSGPRVPVKVAS